METPASHSEVEALKEQLAQLSSERDEYKKLAALLREEVERLKRGLIGQKRERFVPGQDQLTLSLLASALSSEMPEAKQTPVKPHTRNVSPTGRNIPDDLPRVDLELIPEEVQRAGLDAFERIGADVSEVVERRAGGLVVVRTIRGKYVPRSQKKDAPTKALIAPAPELPIERGMAGPGLMAETVLLRWQFHQPANRQESYFARDGLQLARSTICDWHINLSKLCDPLLDAMWKDALQQALLMVDATGVLVQAKETCRKAHFWVVVSPRRQVLFRYTTRHNCDAVDGMLKNYHGYLVADAHTVYDHLFRDENRDAAVECGCWSHARRYFFKALSSDPDRGMAGLLLIKPLFDMERAWKSLAPSQRLSARREHAEPIIKRFFSWVEEQGAAVLPETPISKALGYARNQRAALSRFLEDGNIPIHNNESERQLRREAVGRKNWLFVGSDDGAHANATFVSLLASCQLHGLEPWAYLRDLPSSSISNGILCVSFLGNVPSQLWRTRRVRVVLGRLRHY